MAYKVYKELERVIRHAGIAMSVEFEMDTTKVIRVTHRRSQELNSVDWLPADQEVVEKLKNSQ